MFLDDAESIFNRLPNELFDLSSSSENTPILSPEFDIPYSTY